MKTNDIWIFNILTLAILLSMLYYMHINTVHRLDAISKDIKVMSEESQKNTDPRCGKCHWGDIKVF